MNTASAGRGWLRIEDASAAMTARSGGRLLNLPGAARDVYEDVLRGGTYSGPAFKHAQEHAQAPGVEPGGDALRRA